MDSQQDSPMQNEQEMHDGQEMDNEEFAEMDSQQLQQYQEMLMQQQAMQEGGEGGMYEEDDGDEEDHEEGESQQIDLSNLDPEQLQMLQQQLMQEQLQAQEDSQQLESGENSQMHQDDLDNQEGQMPSHFKQFAQQQDNQEDISASQQMAENQQYNEQGGIKEDDQQSMDSRDSLDHELEIKKKVRQNIFQSINQVRREHLKKKLDNENVNVDKKDNIKYKMSKNEIDLYFDLNTTNIATSYAEYLRMDNDHNPNKFNELLKINGHLKDVEPRLIFVKNRYEDIDDTQPLSAEQKLEAFNEATYLLEESQEERQILFDDDNTHIGIGVDYNDEYVVVVLVITKQVIYISKVFEESEGEVIVKGKVLEEQWGIWAIRVSSAQNKEIVVSGPDKIDFDKNTREFIVSIKYDNLFSVVDSKKFFEVFNKKTPDLIPYKKATREKLELRRQRLVAVFVCEPFPNPKIMQLEEPQQVIEQQQEKLETDSQKSKTESSAQEEDKGDDDDKQKSQGSQSESEDKFRKSQAEPSKEQISNKEIREELEVAIAEAKKQYDNIMIENLQLQEKIIQLRNKDHWAEKQTGGDSQMSDHKYQNTLAHVHQIRLDLNNTKDRYNKMAYDLQLKLEDKQHKCSEIKLAFMELKREVAKKAAFSRTDKPIPDKMIAEWEEKEIQKNKELQELRLENLRLRNNLLKNQKILKKKEELAEGLHLIDFEQLKIENQTLNEKIEERNEDLHKLKKKNTNTVQTLTHTKEKLSMIQAENDKFEGEGKNLESDLGKLRTDLTELKIKRDKKREECADLKQQSGIVNNAQLIHDFDGRQKRIKELSDIKTKLYEQLLHMKAIIKEISTKKLSGENWNQSQKIAQKI